MNHSVVVRARDAGVNIYYVFVEGNIGVGKTSLLKRVQPNLQLILQYEHAKHCCTNGVGVLCVPEPLDAWRNIPSGDGGPSLNLMEAFYGDKRRWAALFQCNAMVTRVAAVDSAIEEYITSHWDGLHTLYVLCERSVHTDRHVFVRALAEEGAMNPLEVAVYENMWRFWEERLHPGEIAGVIYLQATAKTCAKRVARRARGEENGIMTAYLERLGALHDEALRDATTWRGAPRLQLDAPDLGDIPGSDAAAERAAVKIADWLLLKQ